MIFTDQQKYLLSDAETQIVVSVLDYCLGILRPYIF